MRSRFNPRVDGSLSRAAETLAADVSFLEGAAADLLQRALTSQAPGLEASCSQALGSRSGLELEPEAELESELECCPGWYAGLDVMSESEPRTSIRQRSISGQEAELESEGALQATSVPESADLDKQKQPHSQQQQRQEQERREAV